MLKPIWISMMCRYTVNVMIWILIWIINLQNIWHGVLPGWVKVHFGGLVLLSNQPRFEAGNNISIDSCLWELFLWGMVIAMKECLNCEMFDGRTGVMNWCDDLVLALFGVKLTTFTDKVTFTFTILNSSVSLMSLLLSTKLVQPTSAVSNSTRVFEGKRWE